MATYNEQLQEVWHSYAREHGHEPATSRDAVHWGVLRGMIVVPTVDPLARLAEDMSAALREEFATDSQGRRYRVNHAVRVLKLGVNYTFWAIMKDAPRSHMQTAFTQRRDQIVGDVVQLATDIDAYNAMNSDEPPLQMSFNFGLDLAERRCLKKVA